MRIRHKAPLVGLLCLAVAGCTTVSRGEPTPAPTSQMSTTGSSPPSSSGGEDDLPSHGAPKVEEPLEDTSRFEQNPCSVLTTAQAQELDLPASGEQEDGALGLDCEWFNSDTRGEVTIGFLTNSRNGLSGFYAANQRGEYPYFIELPPIEGYPAIASDVVDRRSEGACIVDVGVTDQLAFGVYLVLSQVNVRKKDPCETAALVAGMALRTMKGA
jgi:hypothetical protein